MAWRERGQYGMILSSLVELTNRNLAGLSSAWRSQATCVIAIPSAMDGRDGLSFIADHTRLIIRKMHSG